MAGNQMHNMTTLIKRYDLEIFFYVGFEDGRQYSMLMIAHLQA